MHSTSNTIAPAKAGASHFVLIHFAAGNDRNSAKTKVNRNAGSNNEHIVAVPAQSRPAPVNMAASIAPACPSVSARNRVKPSTTTSRVYTRPRNLPRSRSTGSAPLSSSTEKQPCHSPHNTKFQLAPCHNPVAKKTRKRLAQVRPRPFPIPAQRDIQIVAEPGGQRDVPPAPEFLNCGSGIRILKVFLKVKPEHPAHADRHIAVAGKIKIDLQCIAEHAHPGGKHADLPRQGKHHVTIHSHGVGNQQLFGQAANKTPDAERGLFRRCAALVDLFFNIVILDDRTGDQLRKKRNIEQNLHKGWETAVRSRYTSIT